MPKKVFSRRAEILKRALDCFNQGQYMEHGSYTILGGSYDDVLVVPDTNYPDEFLIEHRITSPEERKVFNEIVALSTNWRARLDRDKSSREAKDRTSLGERQEFSDGTSLENFQAEFAKLSSDARTYLADAIEKYPAPDQEDDHNVELTPSHDPANLLDLFYSYEVVAKLEKVVRRVSLFDPLEPAIKAPRVVEEYFQEAHRCFLYGFPIATAVLCRAVSDAQLLELADILDPKGKIKRKIDESPPPKPSYLKALINRAAEEGLLDETRELLGRKRTPHWADEIIDAGNWAVHDLKKFNSIYGGDSGSAKVSELLAITRKAVTQLLRREQ